VPVHSLLRTSCCSLILAASVLLTGCASIVSGTTQIVSVDASLDGAPVMGAKCTLTNSKGVFYVTTPGTVPVHRDYADLAVACAKDALPPGSATVKSSVKGMAAGNILLGGVIGAAVDASSGAAYDYPDTLHLVMGQRLALGGASANPSTPAPAPAVAAITPPPGPLPPATPVPTVPAVPQPPAELWTGRISCGALVDQPERGPYSAKFSMEKRGASVIVRNQNEISIELMSGRIVNGNLALTGNGYRLKEQNRRWDYAMQGELPDGTSSFLAKGAMLVRGKLARECQLTMVRGAAPAVPAAAAGRD